MSTRLPYRYLLITIFLFFYVPLAYYYGYNLPDTIGIDFPSYFYAAHFAFVDHKTPYGLAVFDGLKGFTGGKVQPYFYPPPSLLAFWPLAKLSLWHARSLFLIVSHACYLGSIWMIINRLTPMPVERGLKQLTVILAMVYMLCFNPALDTLGTGQINFVALLFICIALSELRREAMSWRIALPLSISILLKTYPVFLLIPVLFRKRYRAAVLTCLFFAGFTALAWLVLPKSVWPSWFFGIVPLGGYANNQIPAAFCWNQSINAFVMRLLQETYFSKAPLLHPSLAKPVATILAVVVVLVTTYFSFRASRTKHGLATFSDQISAFLLMMYLIAPLSWDHHLVYVLPAAIFAITLLVTQAIQGRLAIAVTAILLFMAWRFPVDRLDIVRGWWTLLMSAKLYTVVGLWLFFIYRLRRNPTVLSADAERGPADESAGSDLSRVRAAGGSGAVPAGLGQI